MPRLLALIMIGGWCNLLRGQVPACAPNDQARWCVALHAAADGQAPDPQLAAPAPVANLQYFVTAGGGAVVPGHGGAFAYWSISRYLGQQTYATVASQYVIQKGIVVTCPLAPGWGR